MKKFLRNAYLAVAVLAASLLAGCSQSSELDSLASANDFVIVKGNVKTLFENAGCEFGKNGIEYSSAITKMLKEDRHVRQAFNTIAEFKGIKWDDAIFTVDPKLNILAAANITSQKEFCSSLEDALDQAKVDSDSDEEDGYKVYSFDRSAKLFVKENIVYFAASPKQEKKVSTDYLSDKLENASNNPLASWQKDALNKGNLCNILVSLEAVNAIAKAEAGVSFSSFPMIKQMYDMDEFKTGWTAINLSLSGLKLSGESYAYTEKGAEMKVKMLNNNIDTSMLEYTVPSPQAVMMIAMPKDFDWYAYFEAILDAAGERYNSQDLQKITDVIKAFDGTVVASFKFTDNQTEELPQFMVAAQVSASDGRKLFEMIKEEIDKQNRNWDEYIELFNDPSWESYKTRYTYDGTNFTITDEDINLYGKIGSDVTYFGTSKNPGDASDLKDFFSGNVFGFYADVPSSVKYDNFKLPFGYKLTATSKNATAKFEIEMTDTDGLLLDNILSLVAGQM